MPYYKRKFTEDNNINNLGVITDPKDQQYIFNDIKLAFQPVLKWVDTLHRA